MFPGGETRGFVAALLACLGVATKAFAQAPSAIPGLRFTMMVTTALRGAGSGTTDQKLTARVVEAAGRGRMDIVDGSFGAAFGKGDYLLFDGTGFLIVRPGSKEFTSVPAAFATRSMELLQVLPGVQVSVNDVRVSLDTIRRVDTIETVPTRHYRLVIAYAIALDAGMMKDTISSDVRSDFWIADLPGFPPTPFSPASSENGNTPGALKDMMDRVAAAAAPLRRGVPLKSVSVSRMTEGNGPPMVSEQTMRVVDYEQGPVEVARLVLPPDYREISMPGMENLPVPPSSAKDSLKWRTRPDKSP